MTDRDRTSPGDQVLAFERVGKSYGDVEAVREVSFGVERGEVLGLLGPNGAGKTTLISVLMDILRPTTGRVWLFGEPLRRSALDRVGYLPEERGLYTKLKVLDVLTYFGALKGLSRAEARRRAQNWLQRVELPEVGPWRVDRLSKGMSQKVQIAATLLADPELCVLDEPFSGLDPVNVRLVKELIEERRRNGQTTILSTHQMNMVEELCDRVALIHRGVLMEYGGVEEVRRRYTPLEVAVRVDGPLPELAGVVARRARGPKEWLLRLERGTEPSTVLTELVQRGVAVESFESVLASMEEVFVQVVKGTVGEAASEEAEAELDELDAPLGGEGDAPAAGEAGR